MASSAAAINRRTSVAALIFRALALLCSAIALGDGAWAASQNPYPRAASAYAVVVDGELVWSQGLDARHSPASLTKLLTALVLLDSHWDPTATVIVSARAASIDGTRLGLKPGESLRAADALTALLVRSANDACIALAEHAAGTVEAFAQRMNQHAAKLGMTNSSFAQPCGLEAAGQFSCVRDLLRLSAEAISRPEIAERANLITANVSTIAGRSFAFTNNNKLIGRQSGVIGLKSGFTGRAGKSVIAVAVRGTHSVWVVLLDSPNRWWMASGLIEQAFSRIHSP